MTWKRGVETFGSDAIKSVYVTRVYMIGRDTVPPEVLTGPDILVFTDEYEGPIVGVAVRAVPCPVRMSKFGSFQSSPSAGTGKMSVAAWTEGAELCCQRGANLTHFRLF